MSNTILPQDLDFIFYHIEKCGGSSLRIFLNNLFAKKYPQSHIFIPEYSGDITQNFMPHLIPDIQQNPYFDYPELKVILSHIRYNDFPHLAAKMKISMIREPIDRVISHYYFFSYPETQIHFIDLPETEFAYFCTGIGNHACSCLGIFDENGEFDEDRMHQRIAEFAFIGTMENICEDAKKIHQLICAAFFSQFSRLRNIRLLHLNKNDNKSVKDAEALTEKIRPYVTYDQLLYEAVKTKNQRINDLDTSHHYA
jgi:hypothetical protein